MTRALFVGRPQSVAAWYRIVLPAVHTGADWIALAGTPPAVALYTGSAAVDPAPERIAESYDAVVLQAVRGRAWRDWVQALQRAGVAVLFEIDDYAHGLRKLRDHDFAAVWDRDALRELEQVMRACDGLICSTPFLAERYAELNPRTWVCRNGIDATRYALTLPERDVVAIGWAGATGHADALRPWLAPVEAVMAARPATRFVSIGQPFADRFSERLGEGRGLSVPFGPVETYPAAMTNMDVALAPSGRSSFYRAKSDLRWLEASALGIPVVADPELYPEVEDGRTGMHAATPAQAGEAVQALVDDPQLRRAIGDAAREHVLAARGMGAMAAQWETALREVLAP